MKLTTQQMKQEEGYSFPYHYLDLASDEHRLVRNIEYLSYLRFVKNLLRPFHGQTVLDVGCGDGRFCYELKDELVRAFGVDYSKDALAFAIAFNPHAIFFRQDLRKLRFSQTFGAAVCIETLEHLPVEEVPVVIKHLSKLLKKEGKLIVTVPSTAVAVDPKHYQHFTESSLRDALSQYFQVETVLGYSKLGLRNILFLYLKRIGLVFLPWSKWLPFLKTYYDFLSRYYTQHLALGEPDKCRGLIAVCRKL